MVKKQYSRRTRSKSLGSRKTGSRKTANKRSSKKRTLKLRMHKRGKKSKTQRGGALFPFTKRDLGTYDYDEYVELEPEDYNVNDEGYEASQLSPTLEWKGTEYPIYTDIDEKGYYIMLDDEEGNPVMVKTSAVNRVKRDM